MSTYKLRRFSKVAILEKVDPQLLFEFLSRFDGILAKQGISLTSAENLPLKQLVTAFLNPDADEPALADALYVIDEMTTRSGMHELLEAAEEAGLAWTGTRDPTPAEVAMWVWLERVDLFEEKHAQTLSTSRRAFQTFFPRLLPQFESPGQETLDRLTASLDDLFEKKRHGRGCHIFSGRDRRRHWFLVRHGEPYHREATNDDGVRSTVLYRPETYDVVTYRPDTGELAINAGSKWEKDLYCRSFGGLLFGNEPVEFPKSGLYNLDPIRKNPKGCLECKDVEGIECVKLRELRFYRGGKNREIEILQALDLFEAFDGKRLKMPRTRIGYAKFEVQFEKAPASRMVSIDPPSDAAYARDPDRDVVEEWMALRGFAGTPSYEEA